MAHSEPFQRGKNVQKNWKRSESQSGNESRPQRRGHSIPLPDLITIDELGTMLDEDLITRLRALEEDKGRAIEAHMDSRPWEEEVAYIRREQQVRRIRRDTHAEYVRRSEEEFNRIEASLPAGDFDNTAFVYAATGGRPRWN